MFRWFGQEKEFNVLVMDLLGPNLEDLFNFCTRKFSLKTVLMIVDQVRSSPFRLKKGVRVYLWHRTRANCDINTRPAIPQYGIDNFLIL